MNSVRNRIANAIQNSSEIPSRGGISRIRRTNHGSLYEVQVAVSDGTHLFTQNVSVSVTNDSLLGDAGMDTLLGDSGNDILNGGADLDTINGFTTGPSKDTISTDSTKVIDTSFTFDFDELLAGFG